MTYLRDEYAAVAWLARAKPELSGLAVAGLYLSIRRIAGGYLAEFRSSKPMSGNGMADELRDKWRVLLKEAGLEGELRVSDGVGVVRASGSELEIVS